ncbi:unnamed protein product, partial [Rotaria magnacalcarata]
MYVAGLTKTLAEQQNTYHDEVDQIEFVQRLINRQQENFDEIWTIMEKRKPLALARRAQQQQQQQSNNT